MPIHWIQGFSKAVTGELLVYPWAYPGQSRALLTRTTDGRMRIEWETDPVPPGPPDEPVTFLWHAGMASGYGAHRFTLAVNGSPCVSFTSGRTTADREWTITGSGGCALTFKATRTGTFDELFGFMWLTLPRGMVTTERLRISVTGEAAGNADYYMTFQETVAPFVRAVSEEARLRNGSRVVRVEVSRVADPAPMLVRSGGEILWRGETTPGYTSVLVPAPGDRPSLSLSVEIDNRPALSQELTLIPVRNWEVHLLPHSHVDIGYSDPQPEVERKQWKNLRDAVALAARTKDYPVEARFRWNVEGLWSVESYLDQASPAERTAFADAVKAGSIGMQANYTNILTGISTPEELARWTDGARRIAAKYGIPAGRSAMHTDIPGLSWTVVSALARAGVRYFSSGPNYMPGLPDRGDRIGHTLRGLGDRPFWWVSPSGDERLLFWMAGRGYSWFHGLNMGKASNNAQQPLLDYLKELSSAGYGYDLVQVRYTVGGDNGPTDPNLPDFVKTWNETFQAPRLVIDTAEGLFSEMERRYGSRLPSLAGDMTPYWEDGAVSTANEEAMVRAAARRLQTAETLFAMRGRAMPANVVDEAWRAVTLWHEHTWGAADSINQPDRKDVVDQWLYKRAFAVDAEKLAGKLLDLARPVPGPLIEVANPSSWPRSGLVTLPTPGRGHDRVTTTTGVELPSQRLASGYLVAWLGEVPALGAVRLAVSKGAPSAPRRAVQVSGLTLDNGLTRVTVDRATGAITSLRSTDLPGRELVTPGQGLNSYFYVAGRDPAAARTATATKVVVEDAGPLVATLRIESEAPGAKSLVRRVTLVAGLRDVVIEDVLDKTLVRDKESAHIGFPFDLKGGVVRADEGDALVTIGKSQLPGSCRDFIGIHSVIDVSNDSAGVSLASADAPLIEIGAMTDERQKDSAPRSWPTAAAPGSSLYAYLLNNYWHTNYKADQAGRMVFRFRLRPHGAFDPVALRRFSASVDAPLVVSSVAAKAPAIRPPFVVQGRGVVLNGLRPVGDAVIEATLYNASSSDTTLQLSRLAPGTTVTAVDPEGREQPASAGPITLRAYGKAVLRLAR